MAVSPEKLCKVCGTDVASKKRTKDSSGRYYCDDCLRVTRSQPPVAIPVSAEPATQIVQPPSPTALPVVHKPKRRSAGWIAAASLSMLITLTMLSLVIKGVWTGEPNLNDDVVGGFIVVPLLTCNVMAVASFCLSSPATRTRLAAHFATLGPPPTLEMKVQALGKLTGRSYGEVIAALGPANSISSTRTGFLAQWLKGGYHLSLLFEGVAEGSTCLGIQSVTSV